MAIRYHVTLTPEEKVRCQSIISTGKSAAYRIRHAHILLAVDRDGQALSNEEAARYYGCRPGTVGNIKRRYVQEGLESALERKKRTTPPHEPRLDGEKEARLITLACSTPPEGRNGWTMQLLADELVRLQVVESISDETVRRTLKKRLKAAS